MKRAKRPGEGRPPKYKKEFCEIAKLKASQGFSVPVIAMYCGNVDRQTIHDWANTHQEFSHSLKEGRAKRLERLEFMITCHQSGHKTKDFDPKQSNITAIIFELKTRFHEDWSDKQKILDLIQRAGGQVVVNVDAPPINLQSVIKEVRNK